MNLAGWWEPSPTCHNSPWRGIRSRRWRLTNWHNQDLRTQLSTSLQEISCTEHPNSGFQKSLSCQWIMMQLNLHPPNLQSWRSVLITAQGYHQDHKGHLVLLAAVMAKSWEASVEHRLCQYCAPQQVEFITDSETKACWICKVLPSHRASLANRHNVIRFGQRRSDGSCVIGGIYRHIVIIDVISSWRAIGVSILLYASLLLISVAKLWYSIIGLEMRKGPPHHTKV